MPIGDKCWKDWMVRLRIEMMRSRTLEVTKTIEEIAVETGTDESIGFDTNPDGKVDQVTFRLNESWQAVLRRNS